MSMIRISMSLMSLMSAFAGRGEASTIEYFNKSLMVEASGESVKNEDVKEAEEEEAIEEYAAHIKRKNTGGKREKKWKNQTKENDLNLSARWFCHSVSDQDEAHGDLLLSINKPHALLSPFDSTFVSLREHINASALA